MAAVRKDIRPEETFTVRCPIRPEETFTVRCPIREKPNHCSPQRHTILLWEYLLCSWPQSRSIFYCKIQRFEANLTFKHSPSAAPATKSNTWPSPNTAPATQSNTWPSPNTAPTTKSNTHSSSSWHMKPPLQCAEQSMSPYKLTKYCACHAKWPLNVWQKCAENKRNVISNAGTIRAWKRKPQPASHVRLLFEVPRSIFYCKIQRFEANLTFKHSPSAAPATKSNTWPSPNTAPTTTSNTWPSPNTAPATQSNTWPSPNTAPTTKVTLLYLTLLYLTLLYLTLLYLTLLYLTLLYLTLLYLTLLYLTLLYLTLLN